MGELEQGFGTGLRAQLERKRAVDDEVEAVADAEVEAAAPVVDASVAVYDAPHGGAFVDETALDALRAELNAALEREHGLRAELGE